MNGEIDINIMAETSLETLIALSYRCAMDGADNEAAQLRSLLQEKIEECDDSTLKGHAVFAQSMLAKKPVNSVDFSEYFSKFDYYTESQQISLLAELAYTSTLLNSNNYYDDIKKIYKLIILRSFDHEPESAHHAGDEDEFEVDYGNLIVELSDIDLLNLIAVDRYLFTHAPIGLGPDCTLNVIAELEHRSTAGNPTATATLAWFTGYYYSAR